MDLEDIKKVELELLLQFHNTCNKLGLRYSLGGGTLLGAIRHKGFIPWDDDIDVMMPRPDYDRFVEYCKEHSAGLPYLLFSYETIDNYIFLESKLSSPNTIILDKTLTTDKNTNLGIYIDIFPIDGLGMTENEAVCQFMKTSLKREILNAKTWRHFFRSKTHPFYYEPIRFFVYVLSRFANPHRLLMSIDKTNRSVDFDKVIYSGSVCGAYRLKEIMETSVYNNYIDVEFENYSFKAIENYDAYLSKHYGNYMELPPVEKRVSHHTFEAFWAKE